MGPGSSVVGGAGGFLIGNCNCNQAYKMSVTILSTGLFYDEFTGSGGGGSPYQNGNVTRRMKRVIDFYVGWSMTGARFVFNNLASTITIQNSIDSRSFITQGFKTGDSITVNGTVSNNTTFVISSVFDRYIVTNVAPTNETCDNGNIYGDTPITSLDYLFNNLPNGSSENYISLIDPASQQKFFANGLDATDVTTTLNMRVATKSFAWVTNIITNALTGETSEVTLQGKGVSNHQQKFQLVQYFYVPIYLPAQFNNFRNNIIPNHYNAGNSLQFIFRLNAKFIANTPYADHTGAELNVKGTGSWFDEGALGSRPEYYISSVVYSNNITTSPMPRLDVGVETKVVLTINSRSAKFTNSTKMIAGFTLCPSSESDFQNTQTAWKQNFNIDRVLATLTSGITAGEQNGTVYQALKTCNFTKTSSSVAIATIIFSAGSTLASFWKAKPDNDRYYKIWIDTQDVAITTTVGTDAVTCGYDFQSADYDKTDSSLFAFSKTGLFAFPYPDLGTYGFGSANGFEGDPFLIQIPFRIKQHLGAVGGIANYLKFQVAAIKTGKSDFILEQKIIDLSINKKLLQVQQLQYSDVRGFISYDGDPLNSIEIIRDASSDTGSMSGFIAQYGLVLRYESWISAIEQYQILGANGVPDIALDIDQITHQWSNYNNVQGWNLVFRIYFSMNGNDGNENIFTTSIPITVAVSNQAIWSGSSGVDIALKYYDQNETEELKAIVKTGITKIRATYNGNFPPGSLASGYYGWMFSNLDTGGIYDRRFASSEIPSESDSPFSPTAADVNADSSYANGGIRINIYNSIKVVLETYFDSTIYGNDVSELNIFTRMGTKYIAT